MGKQERGREGGREAGVRKEEGEGVRDNATLKPWEGERGRSEERGGGRSKEYGTNNDKERSERERRMDKNSILGLYQLTKVTTG